MTPTAAVRVQGQQHRLAIQLLDQYGNPLSARGNLSIWGANSYNGHLLSTGEDGTGSFAYVGSNAGQDTLSLHFDSAYIDPAQATVTVQWLSPAEVPTVPTPFTVAATPIFKTRDVGQYHSVEISISDQYGRPLTDRQVAISRSGANPTAQPETAWYSGDGATYRYEYRGTAPGQDILAIEVAGTPSVVGTKAAVEWRGSAANPLPSDPPMVGPGGLAGATGADTPAQVIAVSVNLKQAYLDSVDRRLHFAQRIKVLKEKLDKDGMARPPDVLLLQEIRRAQAQDVAARMNNHLGGTNYVVASAESSPYVADSGTYEIRGESAILINANTMKLLGTGHIDHSYTKEDMRSGQKRLSQGVSLDLDKDGTNDCDKPKWKRTPYALLGEKEANGQTFVVASVHFVLDNFIEDKDKAREYKAQWSTDLANRLRTAYPTADVYGIGGDFNQTRCFGDGIEPSICDVTPFWARLAALGFVDTVYALHGESDSAIRAQYEDGWFGPNTAQLRWRDKRIDYIFSAGRTAHCSASHDLTCGYRAPEGWPWNCKELDHPHNYSDHRLVWAYMRSLPRAQR